MTKWRSATFDLVGVTGTEGLVGVGLRTIHDV